MNPEQPYGNPEQPQYTPPPPPQQPYGAPQQPYGAPQQPYGAPQQPYSAPQQGFAGVNSNMFAAAPSAQGRWGVSTLGNIGAEVMAGLAYLSTIIAGPVIPIVLFFIEKNRFARFHAAQAMILAVAVVVIDVILAIAGVVIGGFASASNLGFLGFISGLDFACLLPLIGLAFLGLWIWGMIAGFTGRYQKLPIVGDFAERLNGGPLTPGMV
ncbi:MAG TPA: DUF4870 domain-containing protein [Ktedonobacterales bacterium]|nr:DUF4870 domain-containing protein [Ktedonobacterales bacterium]